MAGEASLRVRKNPLELDLALVGSLPRRVELFLAEHGSRGFDRQRVLELLDEADSYLPARDLGTGDWESFNAGAIAWIGMSRATADADGPGENLYDHRKLVRVEFERSEPLEGEILYSAPEGSARVVDVLNRPDRYFRLCSGDRVFLVNKDSVLRVVEATISGDR